MILDVLTFFPGNLQYSSGVILEKLLLIHEIPAKDV